MKSISNLHNRHIRLAPWINAATPRPEQTAYLEDALDHARSWLNHGERRPRVPVSAQAAPIVLHPKQAA